jgi:hypothetical protein
MTTTLANRIKLNIPETLLVDELIKGADAHGRGEFHADAHGAAARTHGRMSALKRKGVLTSEVRDGVVRYSVHPEFLTRNPTGCDIRESAF